MELAQLNRITISGFKSIKKCDIFLNKINVLIGSNGSGKSNFISAFSLLQDILSENLRISAARSGANTMLYNGRKTTKEIAVEVFFGSHSYGFVLVPTDDGRLIFEREYFGYYGAYETQSDISHGHGESLWKIGVKDAASRYMQPILAKQNWRVYHFHDTGRNARVKQEHNISNNHMLMNDASNLAAFLYRLKLNYNQNYTNIVNTVRLIAPYFLDFVLEPQEANRELIILKWKQKGLDDIFNASQLSDGTLRFICLAALLLQPHELQPATIIIDEPELGLPSYAITILSEMVKRLPNEKQIIISTQSAELLNEFDVDDVIVVDRDENGSKFQRLDEKQLAAWLEEDYTLENLWKKNILGARLSKVNLLPVKE